MDVQWGNVETACPLDDIRAMKAKIMESRGIPPEPMLYGPIVRRPMTESQAQHDPRYLSFWGVDHPAQTPDERLRAQRVRAREKLHAWIRLPERLRGRA